MGLIHWLKERFGRRRPDAPDAAEPAAAHEDVHCETTDGHDGGPKALYVNDLPPVSRDGLMVQSLIASVLFGEGADCSRIEQFFREHPGPAPEPCPHCGCMRTYEKLTDSHGAFVGWCPWPGPCPNPECEDCEEVEDR